MQQIVAKGVNDFVSWGLGNRKRAAVDHRAGRSRDDGFHMADIATERPEKLSASFGCGGRGKHCISRWNHGAAYELSEVVDVSQAEFVWLIVDARRAQKNSSDLCGSQSVRDSHLVQVSIADKGEQAAVLVLPAEASDASLARRLKDGSLNNFPMYPAVGQLRLCLGDRDQRSVINGFYKSIA